MNKDSAKNFKVVNPAGITVITQPVSYDENTLVVLDTSLQATQDMIARGDIVEIDAEGNAVTDQEQVAAQADAPALVEGADCDMPDGEKGIVKAEGENSALICVRKTGDENDTSGDVTNDDGSVTHADGTTTHVDGSVTDAEGKTLKLATVEGDTVNDDGSVTHADGTTTHLDGSVTDAEGAPITA